MNWFTYPVCFGWLPECCLNYTACRGWLCKSEWSIFPQADAGTLYRRSLPRTPSSEGSRAPQRPKGTRMAKINEGLQDKTRLVCRQPILLKGKNLFSDRCRIWKDRRALFMAESGSHPCCLWATSSTGIVAACLCPTGYMETIASILYKESKDSSIFPHFALA